MGLEESRRERRMLIEAVLASVVGTTIEWYDFFLYGTVAALVFPRLFFPGYDPLVGQLLSFGTFTAGFVARPLGALIFGQLGDRVGRKATLVATLLLMGASTFLIGLVPSYDRIGAAAPLVLTLLRSLQGIGVGGEWGGAVLLAVEYGHRGRRGFYASWPQAGVPLGLLLSTGVVALLDRSLSAQAFLSWGWRVPFFLSAGLIVVGLLIRVRIVETPLFRQLAQSGQLALAPVRETLRRYWREVLLAAGVRIGENSCFYLFSTYVIAYCRTVLGMEPGPVLMSVNAAAALSFFTIPAYGLLSDRFSRRAAYMAGCLFLAAFAFPYYALLATRTTVGVVAAVLLSLPLGHALLYSVQGALIPELFATRVRYTGASLGYQLGAPLAGGLAPLIAAWLVKLFPGAYWPLALYVILVNGISLFSVWALSETSRRDLTAEG
jgi:MHS family shikimate/dehydroshikimate transporter-like MFS transporter